MAFLKVPPVNSCSDTEYLSAAVLRIRERTQIALARFLWISMPECPPVRPDSVTSILRTLRLAAWVSGKRKRASSPPAHPTVTSSSFSESRLSIKLLRNSPGSSSFMPTMDTSSPTVNRASSGPCLSSGSVITASAAATPIQSSAPSVVPSAVTYGISLISSILRLSGSLVKS